MRHRPGTIWVTIAACALLTGCGRPAPLSADHAWVRLNAVPGRPAAAYFTLHGDAADTVLVRVDTPAAVRAEMHESMAGGMRPIADVRVAAGTAVAFAPGGRHVMLLDPDPRMRPGATTTVTLGFADGRRLTATAKVMGAADAALQ